MNAIPVIFSQTLCLCSVVCVCCFRLTVYEGCSERDLFIQYFWSVLSTKFDSEQRGAFIQFVWGRTRLPSTAQEFERKFKIIKLLPRADATADEYLPVAHSKNKRETKKNMTQFSTYCVDRAEFSCNSWRFVFLFCLCLVAVVFLLLLFYSLFVSALIITHTVDMYHIAHFERECADV